MKFVINSQILAQELRLLNQVVLSKTPIPILTHALFQATEGQLMIAGTDREVDLRTTCKADVSEDGYLALPVQRLLSLIEQFPDTDIAISTEGLHVHLASGAFRSRLQAMDAEDFPSRAEPEGQYCMLGSEELCRAIARVRYAVGDGKFLIPGALLTLNGAMSVIAATDGKRLSLSSLHYQGEPAEVVIPIKALDILKTQLDNDFALELTIGARHLFFQTGPRLLVSRTLEAKFPNYQRIIPRDSNKTATIQRTALAAALRRVGQIAEDDQATYFDFKEGALDISSRSAMVGEAIERVAMEYVGEPVRVCARWKSVLDFLEAAVGQQIVIQLKDTTNPMLLSDGESFVNVVVLMRA